jgi:hypothetical protein
MVVKQLVFSGLIPEEQLRRGFSRSSFASSKWSSTLSEQQKSFHLKDF